MTVQQRLTAIVVDDERFVRVDLCHMLTGQDGVEVVGEASSLEQARQLLARRRPDVVFLDIQLRGESGFDLVPDIDRRTGIVFVTVHDQYALRAFEVNALDYIIKPVSPDRLADAVERLRARGERRVPAAPAQPLEADDSVFLSHGEGARFVRLPDVVAVTSIGGNYTTVELLEGSQLTVRRSLKEWGELLPPGAFLTVHRSGIANMLHAQRLVRQRDGGLALVVAGREEPLPVSRRRAAAIRSFLTSQR